MPEAKRIVFAGQAGMAALLAHDHPSGAILTGLDCMWGFATPLIGGDAPTLVAEFGRWLTNFDFHALSLSGVVPDSALDRALTGLNPVGSTHLAQRCVADLNADFDAWLDRRSPRFRKSLRSAVRRCETAGVTFDLGPPTGPAPAQLVQELMNRVLAIEARSWKTGADSGLVGTDLGDFTTRVAHRFGSQGDLRAVFAVLDGIDIGYVIGGRVSDRYRGFQHSFDDDHRALSLGKALQFHNIAALAAEGVITYDLGMHMDYKESYTDRIESTVTKIFAAHAIPRP